MVERQSYQLDLATYPPTVNDFNRIPQADAQRIVSQHRQNRPISSIGCIISANAPDRASGYVKINLRNTWINGVRVSFQPYLHQLVLLTAGRRGELEQTLAENNAHLQQDDKREISHLCHNGGCTNPDHLIIEGHADNLRRNSCQGHFILHHGYMTYHPCTHRELSARMQCILPSLQLQDGYHQNSHAQPR